MDNKDTISPGFYLLVKYHRPTGLGYVWVAACHLKGTETKPALPISHSRPFPYCNWIVQQKEVPRPSHLLQSCWPVSRTWLSAFWGMGWILLLLSLHHHSHKENKGSCKPSKICKAKDSQLQDPVYTRYAVQDLKTHQTMHDSVFSVWALIHCSLVVYLHAFQ